MEYEIENIEEVMADVLQSMKIGDFQLTDVPTIEQFLLSEFKRIEKVFRQVFIAEQERCQQYFSLHQQRVIELIGLTYRERNSDYKPKFIPLLQFFVITAEKFLSLISVQYPKFFDRSLAIPLPQAIDAKAKVSKFLSFLINLREKSIVERDLLGPVIVVVEDSFTAATNGIAFSRIQFLETLEDEILRIDFSIEDANWRRLSLCQVLIKTNFNDPDFFRFYTRQVENSLVNCESLTDRIELVGYFYKVVNQIFTIDGVGLRESERPAKLQLLEWISYELEYLQQKQRLQLSSKDTGQIKADFKIIFDLSVAQLGYLFKILVEAEVIQNKNISEVIRFLAQFVKTKKAESISYESLRIKFYNTESGTKDAVKKTFQSLLSYINKN